MTKKVSMNYKLTTNEKNYIIKEGSGNFEKDKQRYLELKQQMTAKQQSEYYTPKGYDRKAQITKDFNSWNKTHKNFMTPNVIKTTVVGNRIIELSSGKSIIGDETIYGVTTFKYVGGEKKFATVGNDNKPFNEGNAKQDAEKHFEHLKKKYEFQEIENE